MLRLKMNIKMISNHKMSESKRGVTNKIALINNNKLIIGNDGQYVHNISLNGKFNRIVQLGALKVSSHDDLWLWNRHRYRLVR